MSNSVPVVLSCNEFFVPYMSVMLASLVEHASAQNSYEIIVFHAGISQVLQDELFQQIKQYKNFSIRLLDVREQIKGFSFYTENRNSLTEETYYRLLAPYLLAEYEKAIYMDGDMVVLADVAKLHEIDLGSYLIGAVRDYCGLAEMYDANSYRRAYMESILNEENLDNYYVAGLLVMNLKQFRECFTMRELLEMATSREWEFHDQDVLNVLTQGRTLILDSRWNVLQNYGKHQLLPNLIYDEWKRSIQDPWIIHYGGHLKPWLFPRVPRAKYFWHYAVKTHFYNDIKHRKREEWRKNSLYRKKYLKQLFFPLGGRARKLISYLRRQFL